MMRLFSLDHHFNFCVSRKVRLLLTLIILQAPMMEFIDTHCDVFTGDEENKFEHRYGLALILITSFIV